MPSSDSQRWDPQRYERFGKERSQPFFDLLEGVIEWVAGTMLNAYRTRPDDADFERFCARHRGRLLQALPDDRPYPFTFPRIPLRARKPR